MHIDKKIIEEAFNILLTNVKKHEPICYSEFYKLIGLDHAKELDRLYGSQLLEQINEISGKEHMISSFVFSSSENKPYEGFFRLAEKWNRIKSGLSEDEKNIFWIKEMESVYNKYKDT